MKRFIACLLVCLLICLSATVAISEKRVSDGSKKVVSESAEEPVKNSKVKLSKCKVTLKEQTYTYTGSALKPAVTVKYGKTKLKKDTDYKVSYKNNINAGTATVTVKGAGNYEGSQKVTFTIEPVKLTDCNVTAKQKYFIYTGEAIKAKPTVKYGKLKLKEGRDYTVEYKDNTEIGVARLRITGKGNYTGERGWFRFYIQPQKVTGLKVEPGIGQLTVSWNRDKNVNGYQIQYSKNEDFSSSNQKYVRDWCVIDNLDGNTTYYVRVRSMKKYNGGLVYSPWSDAVKATTK